MQSMTSNAGDAISKSRQEIVHVRVCAYSFSQYNLYVPQLEALYLN